MKKTPFAAALVASLVLVPAAFAQFGGMPSAPAVPAAPEVPSAGSGGATPADIDAFQSAATEADQLVKKSQAQLFKAVASKEQIAKHDALVKAANATADLKEKEAKTLEAEKSVQAALGEEALKKAAEVATKKADAKKNEAIKASLWNLGLGAVKDAQLVITGKKLGSGVPSPAVASKIPAVTDTVSRLVSQGDALTKILGGAKALMSAVGLDALPTKETDKPMDVKL